MNAIRHRLFVLAGFACLASPPLFGVNPPGGAASGGCTDCGKQCPTCGTSTGAVNPPEIGSLDWEIKVGLARYPKPDSYTDMAQAAYEKDGNIPTLGQMIGRYFPNSPMQQSQIPLKISETQISGKTFHPSCLFLQSEANIEVLRKPDAGGEFIHQILTDDAFTLIELVAATSSPAQGGGWRIRVWKRNAVNPFPGKSGNYYITSGAGGFDSKTALADVSFRHVAGSENDNNTLIYTQNGSTTRSITNQITQTLGTTAYDAGKPAGVVSKLFDGADLLSQENLVYADRTSSNRLWDYTITRDIFTASVSSSGDIGNLDLTSQTIETYQDFSDPADADGGEQGMKRLVTFSQSGQTTSYTYVPYAGGDPYNATKYGRLASVSRPDGSWSVHTYAMGTASVITEYSSWRDQAAGANDAARKVETTVSGAMFTVTTHTGEQLTAKSQTTLAPGSGATDTLVTTLQWDGTGDGSTLSATNCLTTTTGYFSDSAAENRGRLRWIEHPDGTATTYGYGTDAQDDLVVTVCTGAGSRTGVTAGTEVITTYGLGNIPIAETTTDILTDILLDSWVTATGDFDPFDPLGRPIKRIFKANENDYDSSTYDCCGLGTFRARDGSTTHYYRDPLKRVYKTTTQANSAAPVVATYTAISGLTTTQSRTVTTTTGTSDPVFLGSTTRSLDGLTTTTISPSRKSTADTDRLITRSATERGQNTGDTVTESYNTGTNPAIATGWTTTSTSTHFLDGRVKSVHGPAVTDVNYDYAPNTTKGGLKTSATVSGMTTSTDTYTDALGRTSKTVSPAKGTTFYNYNPGSVFSTSPRGSLGNLASVTEDDDVATTYEYNAKGERTTTKRTVPTGATTTATQTTVTITAVSDDPTFGEIISTTTTVNNAPVSESLTAIDTMDGFTSATRTPAGTTTTFTTRPDSTTGEGTSTTTHPDGTRTVTTITHGLTTEVKKMPSGTGSAISSVSYDYDALQRLQYVTDSRTGEDGKTTYSAFTESGTPLTVSQGSRVTTYEYDHMGRVTLVDAPDTISGGNPLYNKTRTSYWPTGLVKARWGDQTYPTVTIHDEQGRISELRTFRKWPHTTDATGPDENTVNGPTVTVDATTWNYSPATGLLTSKLDATSKGPSYTYTAAGRLQTRTWARPKDPANPTGPFVTTTYGYQYGFLTSVTYSNEPTGQPATPDLEYAYDSFGRLATVKRGGNPHASYTYRADFQPDTETQQLDTPVNTTLTRTYEDGAPGTVAHRPDGYSFTEGTGQGAVTYRANWSFDIAGRPSSVTDDTLIIDKFQYGYRHDTPANGPHTGVFSGGTDSNLLFTLAGPQVDSVLAYDTTRDALLTRTNGYPAGTLSQFSYNLNDIGQRTSSTPAGDAFPEGYPTKTTEWGYNERGELVSSRRDTDNWTYRDYSYDAIGNRITATVELTDTTSYYADQAKTTPGADPLNQYGALTFPETPPVTIDPDYDADGNMTHGAVTGPSGLVAGSPEAMVASVPTPMAADLQWDGENRLIRAEVDETVVTYQYDHLSRLISRTEGTATTRYLYDGWNRIAEYDGTALSKVYLWGIDLSGSPQGAGGVGGLLCVLDIAGSAGYAYPAYDGNGNVSEYVDGSGEQLAHFEYDPFGNLTGLWELSPGLAATFPYRFSTKPIDPVTGLCYYGYRWYDPLTGRWPSRDLIEEEGGMNLYGFVGNDGVNWVDYLGMIVIITGDSIWTTHGEIVGVRNPASINNRLVMDDISVSPGSGIPGLQRVLIVRPPSTGSVTVPTRTGGNMVGNPRGVRGNNPQPAQDGRVSNPGVAVGEVIVGGVTSAGSITARSEAKRKCIELGKSARANDPKMIPNEVCDACDYRLFSYIILHGGPESPRQTIVNAVQYYKNTTCDELYMKRQTHAPAREPTVGPASWDESWLNPAYEKAKSDWRHKNQQLHGIECFDM